MLKRILPVVASATLWLASTVFAAEVSRTPLVLLTENFPPYNMAKNGKNFAQDANIEGIAVDILRETFKRADIAYSMTLRFPWERIYNLALNNPGYGVFVTARVPEREALFKWVGPLGPGGSWEPGRGSCATTSVTLSAPGSTPMRREGPCGGSAASQRGARWARCQPVRGSMGIRHCTTGRPVSRAHSARTAHTRASSSAAAKTERKKSRPAAHSRARASQRKRVEMRSFKPDFLRKNHQKSELLALIPCGLGR